MNRPQVSTVPGGGRAERPEAKNTPAQPRLNTPFGAKAPRAGVSAGSGSTVAALGNSACARSFQVITGAMASTRWS
jgi:hypothetical protein